jgi:hypothetical protein
MSTTDVTVDRLTATLELHPSLDRGEAGRWLARMQAGLVGFGLERGFSAADLPPGHWFLRRVDLPVVLDPSRPEISLVADWAKDIASAVRRAALAGGSDVVFYTDDAAVVADVVRGLSARNVTRAWAWLASGVLRPGDPDPATRPAAALLALAERQPTLLLPAVLNQLRAPGGLSALDRLLGPSGWVWLVEQLVPSAAGLGQAGRAAVATAAPTGDGEPPSDAPRPVLLRAARMVTASPLATQIRRSALRPAAEVLAAWAILVLAEADPGARPDPALLACTAAELMTDGRPHGVPRTADRQTTEPAPEDEGEAGPTIDRRPAADLSTPRAPRQANDEHRRASPEERDRTEPSADNPAPTDQDDAGDWATGWAGLPFLIAAAADAGLPDAVHIDPRLEQRTLRWVLHAIVGRLAPAHPGDPARLLVAGLTPDRAAELLDAPPPTDGELPALEALAAAWAKAVTVRLVTAGADLTVTTAVPYLARRPGTITGRPGWLEVHLPLDAVDIAVRRAGLDIDPGWVPWLGTVVRYRYG